MVTICALLLWLSSEQTIQLNNLDCVMMQSRLRCWSVTITASVRLETGNTTRVDDNYSAPIKQQQHTSQKQVTQWVCVWVCLCQCKSEENKHNQSVDVACHINTFRQASECVASNWHVIIGKSTVILMLHNSNPLFTGAHPVEPHNSSFVSIWPDILCPFYTDNNTFHTKATTQLNLFITSLLIVHF